MTLRTNVPSDKTLAHSTSRFVLVISALLIGSLNPPAAIAQARYPTFGVPSSVFKTATPTTQQAPAWDTSRGLLRQVSHSEGERPTASSRSSRESYRYAGRNQSVTRAVPQNPASDNSRTGPIRQTVGRDHDERTIFGLFRRRSTRPSTPDRSASKQSSVRPEPTAELQQSPPRHDAAVRPADGRKTLAQRLTQLYDRAPRRRRTPPSQPPVEQHPFVPPTYKSQQASRTAARPLKQPTRRTATSQAPRQPATESRRKPQDVSPPQKASVPRFLLDLKVARETEKMLAPQTNVPQTNVPQSSAPQTNVPQINAPETNTPRTKVPKTNAIRSQATVSDDEPGQPPARQQAAASFELIPLTEPVLAPPAEEEWDRSGPRHGERSPSTQPLRKPQPHTPLAGLTSSIAANPAASEANSAAASLSPADPYLDETPFEDLFPADREGEDAQQELIDDDLFLLPGRTPARLTKTGQAGAVAVDRRAGSASNPSQAGEPGPGPSPYTGHKLDNGAFPNPRSRSEASHSTNRRNALTGTPPAVSALSGASDQMPSHPPTFQSAPAQRVQPTWLFAEDEWAIDPAENLDIDPGSLVSSSSRFSPSGTDTIRDAQAHFRAAMTGSPKQQIVTRDGLGLKGFCPVALRDRRVLEDGRVAYTSYYAGKSYFFSSSQAKAVFDDNPRRYVPAADGYDVTLTAITGEVREGSLDHAVWYKDRLYLFDSAETLKTFMALPSAMKVDE